MSNGNNYWMYLIFPTLSVSQLRSLSKSALRLARLSAEQGIPIRLFGKDQSVGIVLFYSLTLSQNLLKIHMFLASKKTNYMTNISDLEKGTSGTMPFPRVLIRGQVKGQPYWRSNAQSGLGRICLAFRKKMAHKTFQRHEQW